MKRLPLILSATALVVALLGSTPLGQAAGSVAAKVVPFAKRSGYAANAGAVGGIRAARRPTAGRLLPLGANGTFPSSVLQAGPQGPPGPAGAPGAAGISGLQWVYGLSPGVQPANNGDASRFAIAVAECPVGKTLIGGGMMPNHLIPQGYVAVSASGPRLDQKAWVVKAFEVKPYPVPVWQIEAWAVCANVEP